MAPNLKAMTEIYSGLSSDSYHLWGVWGSLPADKIRLIDGEDNGLSVWIANQFINWEHYEETDEFIPCWQDMKRSRGVQEFLKRAEEAGKADRTKWIKKTEPFKPYSLETQTDSEFYNQNLNEELGD